MPNILYWTGDSDHTTVSDVDNWNTDRDGGGTSPTHGTGDTFIIDQTDDDLVGTLGVTAAEVRKTKSHTGNLGTPSTPVTLPSTVFRYAGSTGTANVAGAIGTAHIDETPAEKGAVKLNGTVGLIRHKSGYFTYGSSSVVTKGQHTGGYVDNESGYECRVMEIGDHVDARLTQPPKNTSSGQGILRAFGGTTRIANASAQANYQAEIYRGGNVQHAVHADVDLFVKPGGNFDARDVPYDFVIGHSQAAEFWPGATIDLRTAGQQVTFDNGLIALTAGGEKAKVRDKGNVVGM